MTGECIRPELLSEILKKSPNSVLFLDLRRKANIYPKGPTILFDPAQIKMGIHSNELESLLTAYSRSIFQTRETFELIVYFDESSETVALNPTFQALLNAIYYMEFNKIPKRMPVLLQGGMEALQKEAACWCQELPSGLDPPRVNGQSSETSPAVSSYGNTHSITRQSAPPASLTTMAATTKSTMARASVAGQPLSIPYPKLDLKASSNGIHSGRDHRSFSKDSTLLFPDLSVFQKDSFHHSFPPSLPPKPATPKRQPAALSSTTTLAYPHGTPGATRLPNQPHYAPLIRPELSQTLVTSKYPPSSSSSPSSSPPVAMPMPSAPRLPQTTVPAQVFTSPQLQPPRPPPSGPKPSHPARSRSLQSIPSHDVHQFDPLRASPNPSDILNDSLMSSSVSLLSFSALGPSSNGITGLKNLGNTCFMSSILQCISATLPLTRYFLGNSSIMHRGTRHACRLLTCLLSLKLGGVFRKHINMTNNMGTGGLLAEAYWELARAMWSGEFTFFSPAKFKVSAVSFIRTLARSYISPHFQFVSL